MNFRGKKWLKSIYTIFQIGIWIFAPKWLKFEIIFVYFWRKNSKIIEFFSQKINIRIVSKIQFEFSRQKYAQQICKNNFAYFWRENSNKIEKNHRKFLIWIFAPKIIIFLKDNFAYFWRENSNTIEKITENSSFEYSHQK